ncbi:MAG: hypothetical protein V3T81_04590, partial [Thermoanaerobaculia bacterium]
MSSPEERASNRRALLGLTLLLQLGLGLVVAQLYLSSHNSLRNNGHWVATKTTLGRAVMGAYSFVFGLQPLAKGRLNLAAWHGFQEVIWKEVVDPASAEFDFFLTPGSYLVFLFDKTDQGYSGIRLSKSGRFPPMVFSASPEGGFIRKEQLQGLRRAAASDWQTLRVESGGDGFSVFLNDRQLKSSQSSLTRPHRIGFRGGRRDAFVDNLREVERDGNVLRETFSMPHNWPLVNALSIGAVLLFSSLLCLV